MSDLFNPYVAGNPVVDPDSFFGRQDIVNSISNELPNKTRNSFVLFGQRRIGKTSLLFKLVRDLSLEKYLTVYFDLQDKSAMPLGELLEDLATVITEKAGLILPQDMSFDDKGSDFQKKFLPWLWTNIGKGKRIIILMDEFDVLDEQKEVELPSNSAKKRLIPFLRSLMSKEQRFVFVFVIGRYPEDIKDKNNIGATLKSSLTKEIWLLTKPDTIELIRLAERNKTLTYQEDAANRIYSLTHGHPYFTQLFCQRLWQKAYENLGTGIPEITVDDVNLIIPDVMETGVMGLDWIWNGLQPAEKLFASALAEILQYEEDRLTDTQIQVLISNFEARLSPGTIDKAPMDLKERRIIDVVTNSVEGEKAYWFAIEFFRIWVREKRPLYLVKSKLDEEDKIANGYFLLGFEHYSQGDWQNALDIFDKAVNKNPHHFKATLYKGRTLDKMGNLTRAQDVLQKAYDLDSSEARQALLDVWKKLIQSSIDEKNIGNALRYCTEYLKIDTSDQYILGVQHSLWEKKANHFFAERNWAAAYILFQKAQVDNYLEKFTQISTQEWVSNAEIALENGYLDDTSVAYEQAGEHEIVTIITTSPNNTTAYYKLAEFYEAKRDYVLAKKCLLRITERDTDVVQALLRIIRSQIRELNVDVYALGASDDSSIIMCLNFYQEMDALTSEKVELPKDEKDKVSVLQKYKRHQDVLAKSKELIKEDDTNYYSDFIDYLEKSFSISKASKPIQADATLKIVNRDPLVIRHQNVEMGFVKIKAGIAYLGDDEKTFGIQTTRLDINYEYWLGKYPVTNREYAWFNKNHTYSKDDEFKPVIKITWVQAIEYCTWLQNALHKLGKPFVVRLPNEAEWERAAKGDIQRKYPWGDGPVDENFCNFGRKYASITEVDHFPKGENSSGCWDMVGNIWEWTISVYYDNKLDTPKDDFRKDVVGGMRYVCKGGAWDFPEKYVSCSSRYKYLPNTAQDNLGFRILIK